MLSDAHRQVRNGSERSDGCTVPAAARILAVQGVGTCEIQALLTTLARRWAAAGRRIAGVVEDIDPGQRKGDGGASLRNLRTGSVYRIYQDLGPHSTACCLDPGGFADASQDIIGDLADCDIVVLSKFGKLEAERGGLLEAFTAAALSEKLVITAVSPVFSACYLAFVGSFGAVVSPDEDALHAWGQKLL